MSRSQQDQFIDDDEEETCPLCVEEFDLTDKGFRPCPCGYQVCQFCYNSIKNNMNGLCPACRRVYNDKDIEYKTITPEEMAAHKARQTQKVKKTQAALQKEKQKAEADNLSRKHLAGLRVVQKNLVYVTGLQPITHEDQLLQTLRGQDYFGQYGKIIKIVVSKAKDSSHPNSVGVYVTFERKEDAEKCIAAVNGSRNQDRTLRAQFGTTKYCSAYLRGENCTNRNCMFLHEPGEANESYSRADLSALNAGSSQQGAGRPPPQSQQPVASASQPMARQPSSDQPSSPPANRPALPSTASWASKVPQASSNRPESRSTSVTMESPVATHATPAPSQSDNSPQRVASIPEHESVPSQPVSRTVSKQKPPPRRREVPPIVALLKNFKANDLAISTSIDSLPQNVRDIITSYPPLFDPMGGAKRRLRRQREEEQRQQLRMEQEAEAFQHPPAVNDSDDNPELGGPLQLSGSLQLGGEPEDRAQSLSQPQSAIQPPGLGQDAMMDSRIHFGGMTSPGVDDRGLSPLQQQQMLMQGVKQPNNQASYLNQPNAFQQGPNNPPGHQRNTSRFSFANESSASTNVKPVANAKLMNQQSAMMPPSAYSSAQQNNQFYTSNVQGPPPGIKMTGTPPVGGGAMTFGQGHGFATGGLQYGAANAGLNANEERMRSLLRGGRDGANVGGAGDAKLETDFPPLGPPTHQRNVSSLDETRRPTPPYPPGLAQDPASESRRSTPTVPPGLGRPSAIPDLEGTSSSRPSSRAGLKRTTSSQITPAVPLRPATPAKQATPATAPKPQPDASRDEEIETPTKQPKATGAKLEAQKSADVAVAVPDIKQKTPTPQVAQVNVEPATKKEVAASTEPDKVAPVTQQLKEENKQPAATKATSKEPAPRGVQPASKGQATVQTTDAQAVPVTPSKTESEQTGTKKRTPPGKLDIAAAVNKDPVVASPAASVDTSTPSTALRSVAQTPAEASKPESPIGSIASPASKPAPKTIRVVQTPKTETPTSGSSSTSREVAPQNGKQASRQPSMASIQVPGTPSSEQVSISDHISVPSTSQSRASSPPPAAEASKVSSQTKQKTKSQWKKERQERAKAIEEEKKADEPKQVVNEEPAQEAIVSRKKKTKKEKEPKPPKAKASAPPPTGESTPTASRAPSPPPKPAEETPIKVDTAAARAKSPGPATPTKAPVVKSPPIPSPHEPSPPPTPTLTAAQILADLKATIPELQKSIDSLFRPATSNHFKPSQNITQADVSATSKFKTAHEDFKLNLTKEQVQSLLNGTAPFIRYPGYHGDGDRGRVWDRGLISPGGAHLRALPEELEMRFLELEKSFRDLADELKFRPTKPQNDVQFPSVDLEELKRKLDGMGARGVSVMEQMLQDPSNSKKGAFMVDEASKYINEFVMPPATPPPSAGSGSVRAQASAGAQNPGYDVAGPALNLDTAERHLNEEKRRVEERDATLKKVIKKNKKLLGLG